MLLLASGIFTSDLCHAREFPKLQCKVPGGAEPRMELENIMNGNKKKKAAIFVVLHSITKLLLILRKLLHIYMCSLSLKSLIQPKRDLSEELLLISNIRAVFSEANAKVL